MESVRVNKDELLSVLKENRRKHKAEYKEAIRAFRVKAVDTFNRELQKAIAGKKFENSVHLSKPESHEKDYDLAIKMVEMSVDKVLKLEQSEFNQLVNDEWSWKSSFRNAVSGSTGYSGYSGISGYNGTAGFISKEDATAEDATKPEIFVEVTFPEEEALEQLMNKEISEDTTEKS